MIMINQRITMIKSVTISVSLKEWNVVTVHNFACKGGRIENI